MATLVDATCSECFLPQTIELNPRRKDIACGFCSHSVPMFEKREMDGIRSTLKQERSKNYIALALFGAAAIFFAGHVYINSKPDVLQITSSDGDVYAGYLMEHGETKVRILEKGAEEPISIEFKDVFEDKVAAKREQYPLMEEDTAIAMVGAENSVVLPQEQVNSIALILSVLLALAALVFSAIATQERLVCEF
jgi:hypothetical protein